MSNPFEPTEAQLAAFVADDPAAPVVMVNLLKFRDKADYPAGYDGPDPDVTGRVAYMDRYGPVAFEHVAKVGGHSVFTASANRTLIGPEEEQWDIVSCVFYPARQAFADMVAMPDYQASLVHRTAGLAATRVFETNGAPIKPGGEWVIGK